MKLRNIRPCADMSEKVIVTGKIEPDFDLKTLSSSIKTDSFFSKCTLSEALGMIWAKSQESIVLIFQNGKTIIRKTKEEEAIFIMDYIEKLIKRGG